MHFTDWFFYTREQGTGDTFISRYVQYTVEVESEVMETVSGVSNLWPMGHMWLRLARNAARHKIINLLKT